MNLQAEKLEVVRMILDTDDKDIIKKVKSLFKNNKTPSAAANSIQPFYEGFQNGVQEVKLSLEGKTELKDAKAWLNELQD